MKILIFNGSPNTTKGNSIKVTNAFIQGMEEASKHSNTIKTINIYDNNVKINDCIGCFTCWTKTPGKCAFRDSMD